MSQVVFSPTAVFSPVIGFPPNGCSRWSYLRLVLAAVAVAAAGMTLRPCQAQQNTTIPGIGYYSSIEEIYAGNYKRAAKDFASEVRTPVRVGQSFWIDSICYRTMLGETYYQMGDHERALQEFNAACDLFLSYPRWLLKVNFRQSPRPDPSPNRRLAPWGRSNRQPTYGTLPDTMLISQGEMITEQRARQGGAIQPLQMWRINVIEVIRTTALAIRRRNEILGPLGQHDRMSKNLVDALARGGNAPRNHWSNSWTELLLGLAQQGVGDSQQAIVHLNRGVLLDGRYEHPLTGAALLAQAEVALEAGNTKAALNFATEASYAAYAYDDYGVLGDALELGHQANLAGGGEEIYPPLAAAATWAKRQGLSHLAASFRIAEAEELALAGQLQPASASLGAITSRRRELSTGRLGPRRSYVEAIIAYSGGNAKVGAQRMNDALQQQRAQSLRNLQTRLANNRVDAGSLSPRLAIDLYGLLLRDPTPRDWGYEPLETLAHLTTNHELAFDRWLLSALDREKVLEAIDITEVSKRRRFWLAQPFGGRLLAVAHLLETDPARLSPESRLQRQNLLLRAPEYEELLKQAAELHREIATMPLLDETGRMSSEQQGRFKRLKKNADRRQALLLQFALRRDATNYDMLPHRPAFLAQEDLRPGQAMLVFHQSGPACFAFLLTNEGYHQWRLPQANGLHEQTAAMLRKMGHFSHSRTLSANDLAIEAWQPMAQQFGDLLLGDSRLDLTKTTELILIPDGVLWHVPFEALAPTVGGNQKQVIDWTPVRYSPTVGFALGDKFPPRPIRTTGITGPSKKSTSDFLSQQLLDDLQGSVKNPQLFQSPLSAPSPLLSTLVDQWVVTEESSIDPKQPFGFRPIPLDRLGDAGTLSAWLTLPWPRCERLLLAGVHTVAESGLKSRRRGRSSSESMGPPIGSEMFQVSCSLLLTGAKTVLISRWQTEGQMHRELLREFCLELPLVPADQAWRRSVTLARRNQLDPEQEPRVKKSGEGKPVPSADHPFLWSGYLLIDTGYTSPPVAEDAAEEAAGEALDEAPKNGAAKP